MGDIFRFVMIHKVAYLLGAVLSILALIIIAVIVDVRGVIHGRKAYCVQQGLKTLSDNPALEAYYNDFVKGYRCRYYKDVVTLRRVWLPFLMLYIAVAGLITGVLIVM
jgi:hypothetical protein